MWTQYCYLWYACTVSKNCKAIQILTEAFIVNFTQTNRQMSGGTMSYLYIQFSSNIFSKTITEKLFKIKKKHRK